MNGRPRRNRVLIALQSCAVLFSLIAFITTCCMTLFLVLMQSSMDIAFTKENIRRAAALTFGNVILLSLLCTAVDVIRRRLTVERPLKEIISASERIMRGDFSARIETAYLFNDAGGFDIIIDHINRMAEELGGLETLRTDFIANVSHELKTPLAVMQNYAIMLQSPDLPEEKRLEYARSITASSNRLASLITDILKLNKLETQQLYPEARNYDLGEQLRESLLSFERLWEQKNIEIETQIEEDVTVESDPELLEPVWNNLFSNALKFTEPNGKVSVSLKTENGCAVVSVSDTGCGMSEETGKHIFEKFYQGDTSHAAQGNGLGLALVKRVMDIVGGEISVQSEVGGGSTFTVKIGRSGYGKT
ncbi:MAG: HAMP domain-containing histidine kinase [Bacteroides sp.]|nr:HAMP domain-containing histidine kinase [Bacteroides sp.]